MYELLRSKQLTARAASPPQANRAIVSRQSEVGQDERLSGVLGQCVQLQLLLYMFHNDFSSRIKTDFKARLRCEMSYRYSMKWKRPPIVCRPSEEKVHCSTQSAAAMVERGSYRWLRYIKTLNATIATFYVWIIHLLGVTAQSVWTHNQSV